MKAEIAFDLIMEDDMPFVEGCYRLDDDVWCVFMFRKSRGGIEAAGVKKRLVWESGVTGLNVVLPDSELLNKAKVLQVLSKVLSVEQWIKVKGPDSMRLR